MLNEIKVAVLKNRIGLEAKKSDGSTRLITGCIEDCWLRDNSLHIILEDLRTYDLRTKKCPLCKGTGEVPDE